MSGEERAPYLHLIELIERDLALAGEGRYPDLVTAHAEREAFVATLPATPPACARDLLERAALIQRRLTMELMRGRDELVYQTGLVERGRQTARGYTPPIQRAIRFAENA
jgi:hypothetical protein